MTDENPFDVSTRKEGETLWSVKEADEKAIHKYNPESKHGLWLMQYSIFAALVAEEDWLYRLFIAVIFIFFGGSLVIFGGRDLLLLTGSATASTTIVNLSAAWPCPTRHKRDNLCQTITYSYTAEGKLYELSVDVVTGYVPNVKVTYVTWAPGIYKHSIVR